jgi:hypothetical protein
MKACFLSLLSDLPEICSRLRFASTEYRDARRSSTALIETHKNLTPTMASSARGKPGINRNDDKLSAIHVELEATKDVLRKDM